MYLQLSEKVPVRGYNRRGGRVRKHTRTLNESPEPTYVFMPDPTGKTTGIWVREDYFDNLPENEFVALMNKLEPYQPEDGMMHGGLLNKLFPGRADRVEARNEKKDAKTEIKLAKAEAIKAGTYTSPVADIIGNVASTAANIFGGSIGAGNKGLPTEYPGSGGSATVNPDAIAKPWYKKPVVWVVGGLALAGIGYVVVKKRKKKS